MSIVSRTNYHKRSVTDQTGCTTAFSRASVKSDFDAGVDTASGSPQFLSNLLSNYHTSEQIADHIGGAVAAFCVDKAGRVWGIGNGAIDSAKVYILDPSGTNVWVLVKDFGGGVAHTVFCSQNSGYIFVDVSGVLYRSVLADGTDDFSAVLTQDGDECYARIFSITDATDGTIWVAQYGNKDSLTPANNALRIYKSTNEGTNWTTIFYFPDDFPADYAVGMHLHQIIWNPHNNTLYFSHGDTDPNYIYKSAGGIAGNWEKIVYAWDIGNSTYYYLQPTSACVLPDGNILWGDDTGRRGLWLHDVSVDSFTFINVNTRPNTNFFSMKLINNCIYAANHNGSAEQTWLYVINPFNPFEYLIIDTMIAEATNGWQSVAGKGSDGYVYFGFGKTDLAGGSTVKYKAYSFRSRYGLTIDPLSNNLILDPFGDVGSGGWKNYTEDYLNSTGGKYKEKTIIFRIDQETLYLPVVNLVDPIVLSFWVKRKSQTSGTNSIRISLRYHEADEDFIDYDLVTPINNTRISDDYFWRYEYLIDPSTFPVGTEKLIFRCSPSNSMWYMDCVHLEQTTKPRAKLSRLAAGSAADAILTTLRAALPSECTITGICTSNYQFDSVGLYTLFEAKNAGETHWLKLIFYNGQLMLIDDSNDEAAPVITTATGVPQSPPGTVSYGSLPHDTYYWALRFYDDGGAKVALDVASQRTNVESPAAAAYALANDLTVVYDGCSHTAGEELGGAVIWRDIQNEKLTLDEIKTLWDSQPILGGNPMSLSLGLGMGGRMMPPRRRRR